MRNCFTSVFIAYGHNIAKVIFFTVLCYTKFIGADMDLPRHKRLISSSGPGVENEQLRVDRVRCQGALIRITSYRRQVRQVNWLTELLFERYAKRRRRTL